MKEVIAYIQGNWMHWMSAGISFAFGYVIRKLQRQQKENLAILAGVQCLLRESIIANYHRYSAKGYCPVYARESLERMYEAYHNLGGNDVASNLYQQLLMMPDGVTEEGGLGNV